jgi:predicted RNA binding protein YcfA (HicA-like mRNA interferase family)
MGSLDNIPLRRFRGFLESRGLKVIRTTGGHEVWSRADLGRPVVLQTHIDPVPGFIVRTNLKTIGASKQELLDFLGD